MASIDRKPVVSLVAQTSLSREGIYEYLTTTGNEEFLDTMDAAVDEGLSELEVLVSMMAKLCYKSLTLGHNSNINRVRDIRSNIEAAISSSHGSVLEHASLSFIVRDCSRIFTHELVRHRAGTAFSQNSGRYIRLDSIDLVVDPILDPVKSELL
jgi:thymidylate synthase (FAD)